MNLYDLTEGPEVERQILEALERRGGADLGDIPETVAAILRRVQEEGDAALRAYSLQFDGFWPQSLEFGAEEIERAFARVPRELLDVLQRAAENIRAFHEREAERSWSFTREDGTELGIRVVPVARAGVYVPAGRAPLPSSVLMNVIPAKVAGVREIVMCTPPGRDGTGNAAILAAARIAGADRVFRVGGAQAIAAMAYGTQSIPRVDTVTGPGNAYVAQAKRQVFGRVGIDMIAGPSEVLIVADATANPAWVAADMLSQAEHDPMAASVLVATDRTLLHAVAQLLPEAARNLPETTAASAQASVRQNAMLIYAPDLQEAIRMANRIAPEHLELCVADVDAALSMVQNAGAVFCGPYSPEPMGDYYCGSNHILPTNGTARFSSPVGVWNFLKRMSVIRYSRDGFLHDSADVMQFARSEALEAHARAVEVRL